MKKGIILILLAGVCWGCVPLFTRQLYEVGTSAIATATMRAVVCGVLYGVYGAKTKIFKEVAKKDVPFLAVYGIVAIAGMYVFYALAIQRLSSSVAAILLYTAPAFVTIFSRIFYKDPISKEKVLALLLTFGGCCLVVGIYDSNIFFGDVWGIVFGVLSGLCYSMVTVLGRMGLLKYSAKINAIVPAMAAGLFLGIVCKVWTFEFNLFTITTYLMLGLIGSVIPFMCYMKGIEQGVDGSSASIMATIEPVVATLLGVFVMKEFLDIPQVLGMGLILVGTVIPVLAMKRQQTTQEEIKK